MQYGYQKKQNLMLNSNPLKKLQKKFSAINEVFDCVQKFSA